MSQDKAEQQSQEPVFTYRPLDLGRNEVRLLTLLPPITNEADEPIRCSLEYVSLSDYTQEYQTWSKNLEVHIPPRMLLQQWKDHVRSSIEGPDNNSGGINNVPEFPPSCFRYVWGDYITISYMWGSSERTKQIVLNGSPFAVTANLGTALRNVQSVTQDRGSNSAIRIWADAICINQEDIDERSTEVRRMRNIYAGAFSVIVSLGGNFENSDRALKLIRKISPSIAKGINYLTFKDDADKNHLVLVELFEAVLKLAYHPYWGRVWVIQELALGSDPIIITCGASWAFLDQFRVVFLFMCLEIVNLVADGVPEDLFSKYHTINSGGLLSRFDVLKSVSQSRTRDDNGTFLELAISIFSLGIMGNATVESNCRQASSSLMTSQQGQPIDISSAGLENGDATPSPSAPNSPRLRIGKGVLRPTRRGASRPSRKTPSQSNSRPQPQPQPATSASLGSVHPSKVSKVAAKKKPEPQRQLKISQIVSFDSLLLSSGGDVAEP